jgi:anaerobic magnesium-protoporphyrin IX monomethyl ester cyclase
MDDTFTFDMGRATAVCEEILRRGLNVRWRCTTRADCFSPELARLLKRAGCMRISIGAESGSASILKTIHKNVTPEQTADACRWAREAGMNLEVCFMVGNIGESQETIEETKALARKIRPDGFCVSNAVYMFPGTPLFRYAARRGLIDDSVWLKDDPVFPYTAEHTLEELSAWQMEVIRECAASKGLYQYLRYALRVARRLPPRQMLKSGVSFLKANLAGLFSGKHASQAKQDLNIHG